MLRYFTGEGDGPDMRDWRYYFEIDGEWAIKQIDVCGDEIYCMDEDNMDIGEYHGLCDQPLDDSILSQLDEISADAFYDVWNKGKQHVS